MRLAAAASLAGAALVLAACAHPGDLEMRSPGPDPVVVRTSARFAGAVSSVVYRGVEYVDTLDHGREMQSAASFDGAGECYNPTEAGNRDDRGVPTSRLIAAASGEGWLETETDMAFWLRPGTDYRATCGTRPELRRAVNTRERDGYVLKKRISFVAGMPNVMRYDAAFRVPRAHAAATFEIVTGYMPPRFSTALALDPRTGALRPQGVEGEQALPVLLATADGRQAMGVWSPQLPQDGVGYGTFLRFPGVTKWNCVRRERGLAADTTYTYRCYVAIGTVAEVKQALTTLAARHRAGQDNL